MTIKQILHRLNRRDFRLFPKISTPFKKFLVILLVFGIVLSSKNIFAQENNEVTNAIKEKQDAIVKGNNQEAWLDSSLSSNIVSILASITGGIPFQEDGSLKFTSYKPGGALGTTNNMISSLYNQPVSGIQYIAQVKNDFLGKPAYAQQNTGFEGLQPLLPLWKNIRNTVYVLFSIIFVVIGLMIMLRIKISPQATVTIQNSIPKVITALVLVTFSYAIAGLVIDLSKLILAIGISIFYNAKGITDQNSNLFTSKVDFDSGIPVISWIGDLIYAGVEWISGALFNHHPTNSANLTNMSFSTIYELTNRAIPSAHGFVLGEIAGQIFLGTLLGGLGGSILGKTGNTLLSSAGSVVGDIAGGISGYLIFPLVIAVLMVVWMIKLYFGLLKSYILVIFKIIVGPIQICLGAFPGAKKGFSSWLIDLVANISVFPIVSLFIIALNYLCETLSGGKLWIPSQIDLETLSGNMAVVSAGIGLAGIAMIAKLPKLVPEAIFKIKPEAFGSAIGESYSPVGKFAQKRGTQGWQDTKNTWFDRWSQKEDDGTLKYGGTSRAGGFIWDTLNKRHKYKG